MKPISGMFTTRDHRTALMVSQMAIKDNSLDTDSDTQRLGIIDYQNLGKVSETNCLLE